MITSVLMGLSLPRKRKALSDASRLAVLCTSLPGAFLFRAKNFLICLVALGGASPGLVSRGHHSLKIDSQTSFRGFKTKGEGAGEEGSLSGRFCLLLVSPLEPTFPTLPPSQSYFYATRIYLILSLHFSNLFQGSTVTFLVQHKKPFRIPPESIFPASIPAASTLLDPTHLTLPALPLTRNYLQFPVCYLLSCFDAQCSLCLEFPFPFGTSSNSARSTHFTNRY